MDNTENKIEIYTTNDNETAVEVRFNEDTVWLNQEQLTQLFQRDQSVISRHLNNIFQENELEKKSNMQKMHIANSDKPVAFYNLDVIISVGYRVKSQRGTQFRQWATKRLRELLVQGYTINEKRLAQKQQEVQHLKDGIHIISRAIEQKASNKDYDWLNLYAEGLKLLDDYDHESLDKKGKTEKSVVYPAYKDYMAVIDQMRSDFNSSVFGHERGDGFKSAITQIRQSLGDRDLYPSFEEKAATLLYLIVKNHAFLCK